VKKKSFKESSEYITLLIIAFVLLAGLLVFGVGAAIIKLRK